MSKLLIVDSPEITLWYHEDTKIIHHEIHQLIRSDTWRRTLLEGFEVLKKNGAQKWLSDDRKNIALSPEDEFWGENVWAPQMLLSGWKYWAIVLPETIIAQLNMEHYVKNFTNKNFRVKAFSDPAEALKWLEESE